MRRQRQLTMKGWTHEQSKFFTFWFFSVHPQCSLCLCGEGLPEKFTTETQRSHRDSRDRCRDSVGRILCTNKHDGQSSSKYYFAERDGDDNSEVIACSLSRSRRRHH